MDYRTATLQDVPHIVQTIKALRELSRRSKVQTIRTQNQVLRALPADVLCEVALQLDDKNAPAQAVR